MKPRQPTIPIADLKDRALYRLHSRNLSLGVYEENKGGFHGIREKIGSYFIDTEYAGHTSHALEDLNVSLPSGIDIDPYPPGTYCDGCGKDAHFTPDDPATKAPGKWFHDEGDTPLCPNAHPHGYYNDQLETWLFTQEERFEPEAAAERKARQKKEK